MSKIDLVAEIPSLLHSVCTNHKFFSCFIEYNLSPQNKYIFIHWSNMHTLSTPNAEIWKSNIILYDFVKSHISKRHYADMLLLLKFKKVSPLNYQYKIKGVGRGEHRFLFQKGFEHTFLFCELATCKLLGCM